MDMLADVAATIIAQMQKADAGFLDWGMMLAALGSKLEVPEPIYKFIVLLLLLKVGMGAGISVREADFFELLVHGMIGFGAGRYPKHSSVYGVGRLGHRVLGGFDLPLVRSGPFALRPDNCNQDDRPACKRLYGGVFV